MTYPANPADRFPKGDHNRRLALDIDAEAFAAEAGVTVDELNAYEFTAPDEGFDISVAERVGAALERLEAMRTPLVDNGPALVDDDDDDEPDLLTTDSDGAGI